MTNIQDVSKLAGVSVATVSRTLTSPDKVSPKSREKVFEAIAKVNYKPNLLARNFRTRKTMMIVVLVPDIANPFFSEVIRGIEQTAQMNGYSVLLGDTQGNTEREFSYANMIVTRQADGIIQLSANMPFISIDPNLKSQLPMVNACECIPDTDIPTVQIDNVAAARTMTDHLLSLGHKKISAIIGPPDSPLTIHRLKGFKNALRKAKIEFDPSQIAVGDFSMASGREAAAHIFSTSSKPTAIFCFNDEMAIGAIQHLNQNGLSCPDDVSVAGFDNIKYAEFCTPPLTTIAQPTKEFGSTAMSVLYEILQGNTLADKHITLQYELLVRGSTSPILK